MQFTWIRAACELHYTPRGSDELKSKIISDFAKEEISSADDRIVVDVHGSQCYGKEPYLLTEGRSHGRPQSNFRNADDDLAQGGLAGSEHGQAPSASLGNGAGEHVGALKPALTYPRGFFNCLVLMRIGLKGLLRPWPPERRQKSVQGKHRSDPAVSRAAMKDRR
jgi:hypothetical protein